MPRATPKTLIADAIATQIAEGEDDGENATNPGQLTIDKATGSPRLSRCDPIGLTRMVIAELTTVAGITLDTWAGEVRQIALASAAHGDFKSALTGYEQLGKHLGALKDQATGPTEQHLHLHNLTAEELRGASTEALQARLDAIKRQQGAKATTQDELPLPELNTANDLEELLA
jgi:hypothetical protein